MVLLAALALQASLLDLLPPQPAAMAACERPADLVAGLSDGEIGRRLREGGLLEALAEYPGYSAAMLGWTALGAPVRGDPVEFARALLGGGVAAALVPGPAGAQPGVVAVARMGDDEAAELILEQAARLAQVPLRSVRGDSWDLPLGEGALLRRGAVLAFASSATLADGLRQRLAAAAAPVELLPADAAPNPDPAAHAETSAPPAGILGLRARGADAWLWASGALLRANGFPDKPADLGASLFAADLHESLRIADWVGVTLDCDAVSVRATLLAPEPPGLRDSHAPFRVGPTAVEIPRLPGTLLRGVLRRDLGAWYNARDLYASEAAVAGSVEGDGNFRVLFGRDFGPEVLVWLEPAIVMVAARNPDSTGRALELELPAGAIGLRLKEGAPADLPQGFVNAFLAAITFANFQAGAADEKLLLLDLETLPDGSKLYVGRRRALGAGVAAPLSHNVEPALYLGADREIWLSSSVGMVKEILAAPRDRAAGEESWLELDPTPLAGLLERARAAIVARRLLANGGDQAAAERFADLVGAGAGLLDGARLRLGPADGCCTVEAEIRAQPE